MTPKCQNKSNIQKKGRKLLLKGEHRKERELSRPSYLPQKEFFQEKA